MIKLLKKGCGSNWNNSNKYFKNDVKLFMIQYEKAING